MNSRRARGRAGKRRVRVTGADGWLLPGGFYRVLRLHGGTDHPDARRWIVQELGDDGEWFAHDGSYSTLDAALEYTEPLADDDARSIVGRLPRRVAHAVHALLEAGGSMPLKASEIVTYDAEALSEKSTAAALREARRHGLVDGVHGLWVPLESAYELRDQLERRFLADTADDDA
jgi:hypothetical protein